MRKFTISIFAATISTALLVATATPGFAQAYCACWGTGNVSDTPLLEKTNGAYGYEMSVPPPRSAYAGQTVPGNGLCLFEPSHEAYWAAIKSPPVGQAFDWKI
jgi:hypothetical protein